MEALSGLLIGSQLLFTLVAGLYFYTNLKTQQSSKTTITLESKKELEKIRKLRSIKLTQPLAEKTRPEKLEEIIGQEKGIRALRAALCGPNPQHVILYGPPGIGKTAAARLILKEAVRSAVSPFKESAPFIEMDATILQFDERSIADPLMGSVHDPIYQGAGAYGAAGIPNPRPGAVTRAHGGVLFLDEIGELHQLQMNKLLKVLEDRKVILTSSYYSQEDENIPRHIRDMFDNGLPADFRLVGATTRRPEELPPALRSRCTEIYFRGLNGAELSTIAANALHKAEFEPDDGVPELISRYSANGRDTVNIVQTAISLATLAGRLNVSVTDVEEVFEYGHYSPNLNRKITDTNKIGVVNGLAVLGGGAGALLEIEANAKPAENQGQGQLKVTGIIDEEEINSATGKMKRLSTARASVENVITLVNKVTGISLKDYDIHVNFPGGTPIDGPSAGCAIFTAIYSAILEKEIPSYIAMTGEITIKGQVRPVGGVAAKIEAAIEAGAGKVIIPSANYQESFVKYNIEIICVEEVKNLISAVFGDERPGTNMKVHQVGVLTAKSM